MSARHIPEHALHHVWSNQYIRPEALRTTDGRGVTILDPGLLSLDAGPDIVGLRVVIGDVSYTGAGEVHRTAAEWDAHGHAIDPRYNTVVLHILLHTPPPGYVTRTQSGRIVPMVALEGVLADSLEHILQDAMFDVHDSQTGQIPCGGVNHVVPAEVLLLWLEHLATERFEIKLRRFEERLWELVRTEQSVAREHLAHWGEAGDPDEIPVIDHVLTHRVLALPEVWDQIFYEAYMEGLGYSRNRTPFLTLSKNLTLGFLRTCAPDDLQVEALLFGVSGLLPETADRADAESTTYLHSLRREWNSLSRRYAGPRLTVADWVFSPTRPFNSPVVRIVAARSFIRTMLGGSLFRSVVRVLKGGSRHVRQSLHSLLQVDPGDFWDRRSTFTRVISSCVDHLGTARKDEIIVNAIAPLMLLYARTFHDRDVRDGVLEMLRAFPFLTPNTATRRIETHLLRGKIRLRTAVQHQAMMQLFNYYCSRARCRECAVGRVVWG